MGLVSLAFVGGISPLVMSPFLEFNTQPKSCVFLWLVRRFFTPMRTALILKGRCIVDKIQKAQKVLLDAVLEHYKQNPDQCFTASKVSKALGLYEGLKDKSKYWIAQGLIFELENQGHLQPCENRDGHKYNNK